MIISGGYRRAASHFHSRMQIFPNFCLFLALLKYCLSLPPATYPPALRMILGCSTSLHPNQTQKKHIQEDKPIPENNLGDGGGGETCLKAKNYSRLGFSPHFEMMLRNKPQQVKISPEKTQGFHLNECSLLLFFKGLIKRVENLKYFHLGVRSN